jgi:hypothetical protein
MPFNTVRRLTAMAVLSLRWLFFARAAARARSGFLMRGMLEPDDGRSACG